MLVLPDGVTEAQIAARDAELRKISQLNAKNAKYMNQAIRQAKTCFRAHVKGEGAARKAAR